MIPLQEMAETYDLVLVVLGLAVLGIATLMRRLSDLPLSYPVLVLAAGVVLFALPLPLPVIDPLTDGALALHLAEIGVIVSLMGVGLKIDRLPSWRTWGSTWRLLAVTMPLTIAATALLGWWALGLPAASALLLGVVLSPTDPVLASDVQVGEPLEDMSGGPDPEAEDELRFALTSEAGLNDSLAFPFTFLALLVLAEGPEPGAWLVEWLLVDVLYRLAVGVAAGVLLGRLLAVVLLRLPRDTERDRVMTGMGALAATLILYGVTEALAGYGFLATFIGALAIRNYETTHETHRSLHSLAEQSEQLMMAIVILALGAAVADGVLAELTWPAVAVGAAVIFVIRPAAAWLGLVGSRRLQGLDRHIASFYGVRGLGSIFYLAWALEQEAFPQEPLLWAVVSFVIVLSVLVHGTTAPVVVSRRDRRVSPA